jgi:hypothetical protein
MADVLLGRLADEDRSGNGESQHCARVEEADCELIHGGPPDGWIGSSIAALIL